MRDESLCCHIPFGLFFMKKKNVAAVHSLLDYIVPLDVDTPSLVPLLTTRVLPIIY